LRAEGDRNFASVLASIFGAVLESSTASDDRCIGAGGARLIRSSSSSRSISAAASKAEARGGVVADAARVVEGDRAAGDAPAAPTGVVIDQRRSTLAS
jgi:hypothetical protein